MFKQGDFVQIAPNGRTLDCCQGHRGRIYGPYAGNHSKWILNTDQHFCPVARDESELTLVPPETLAREYFEDEGFDVFESYLEAIKEKALTVEEIKRQADSDPTCRHFLVLYNVQAS